MAVAIQTKPEFSAEAPRMMFEGPYLNLEPIRALHLFDEGWSQIDIAEALGASKIAVNKWF